jgi:hypothetical protein
MRNLLIAVVLCSLAAFAQDIQEPAKAILKPRNEGAALTIYNQNFAVVRQLFPLELKGGENRITFTGATAHIEPDSVILRDPLGKRQFQIFEQNYRNDPISQERLLSLFEGKTIDFMMNGQPTQLVQGKIIRSGYVPHYDAMTRYGQQYYQAQMSYAAQTSQPIIEVNGKLQFFLPGQPVFPALGDDTILKPQLDWLLRSPDASSGQAEVSYVSGGMSWDAAYNVVAPEKGDVIDLIGWVTLDNQSGTDFQNAHIKLMAGDVNKIQPGQAVSGMAYAARAANLYDEAMQKPVTEKAFDEFHLYTLERPTTLHDRETKQVEFVRGTQIKSNRIYVYDGAQIDNRWFANPEYARNDQSYGTQSNPKVWVMQEFKNSKENNLGIPLPAGRLRFYRRDTDGTLQFTGENQIDHTPKDETVRVYTGNSFDIVGERTRTNYHIDTNRDFLDESFEIKVRNHKKEAATVRVVEHLYRWVNWSIINPTSEFKKKDSRTAEFTVTIPPDGEKVITYTAHYTW